MPREKNIELWMHNETGGNIPEYEAALETAMQRYAGLGVHAVKTGYAGGFRDGQLHHSQYGVRHYQRVVETAAVMGSSSMPTSRSRIRAFAARGPI